MSGKEEKKLKWNFVIGNPPYQGENHQQVYPDIYLACQKIGDCIDMVFPTGWQQPKNANNLKKMNIPEVKEDRQIMMIDNEQNLFPSISGAEWTNIIIWKNGFDNQLDGKQRMIVNGVEGAPIKLLYDKSQIKKPDEIIELGRLVRDENFVSMQDITSVRKPYGLSTDVISEGGTEKYGLPPMQEKRIREDDITVYCNRAQKRYVPRGYPFPKQSPCLQKYKVFVSRAWGNMSDTGLGGAFADIIIAGPNEASSESYQESGCFSSFDEAQKHAKYLMTQFCRALLFINKFGQDSPRAWGAVPCQNYSEDFWNGSIAEIDEALMNKYNVPQNIRDFVKNNIQARTEKNIINFQKTTFH